MAAILESIVWISNFDPLYEYMDYQYGPDRGLSYEQLIKKSGGTYDVNKDISSLNNNEDWDSSGTNDLDRLLQIMWLRFNDWNRNQQTSTWAPDGLRRNGFEGQHYKHGAHALFRMTGEHAETFSKYYDTVFKHTGNKFISKSPFVGAGTVAWLKGEIIDVDIAFRDAFLLWLLETVIDQGDRPANPAPLDPAVADLIIKYEASLNLLWNEAHLKHRGKIATTGTERPFWSRRLREFDRDREAEGKYAILSGRLTWMRRGDTYDWNIELPSLLSSTPAGQWAKWHSFPSFGDYYRYLWLHPTKKVLFSNTTNYNELFATGAPFSFEKFDEDLIAAIKEDLDYAKRGVSQMSSEFQKVENLLTWATFKQVQIIDSDDEEWALAKFKERSLELKESTQVLPWGPFNYKDEPSLAWDDEGQRTTIFIDKLTDQYFMVNIPGGSGGIPTSRPVNRTTEFVLYNLGDLEQFIDRSPPHNLMMIQVEHWNNMGLIEWTAGQESLGIDVHSKSASFKLETYVHAGYSAFVAKCLKNDSVKDLTSGAGDITQISQTIQQYWDEEINNTKPIIKWTIFQNAENEMRAAFIETIKDQRKKNPNISSDKLAEAVDRAENEELADSEHFDVKAASQTDLDPNKLNDRQKFFKQCALLLNIRTLQTAYIQKLREYFTKQRQLKPFGNRFYMIQSNSDHDRLYNDLVSSPAAAVLFDLPPAVVSALQPKIRLYKVESTINKISETEFTFPVLTDIHRQNNYVERTNFLATDYDKGDGVGLLDFSFEFNGTNPAEARTDIAANLSLYFQTFGDLVRDRKSSTDPKKTYKYVDLIIQPTPDENKKTINGVHIVHPNQYDPAFYRIRVEVGYNVPNNLGVDLGGIDPKNLQKAIEVNNQSYYLNQVEHDIQIQKDGSVIVNIEYRAYVESVLKGTNSDALSNLQTVKKSQELRAQLYEKLQGAECKARSVDLIKQQWAHEVEKNRRDSLQNIIKQLRDKGRLYSTQINPKDAQNFRYYGFFNKAELGTFTTTGDPSTFAPAAPATLLDPADPNKSTTSYILNEGMPQNFRYNDIYDTTIQFFYFADLLNIITNSMYDVKRKGKPREGTENIKFILGGFDFRPYTENESDGSIPVNIGTMPISVDYFMHWMLTEVLTQGEARSTFPIIYFIRNLANSLMKTALLEACVNRDVKHTLDFQTGVLGAWGKYGKIGMDPLYDETGYQKSTKKANIILNTENLKRKGVLPFKSSRKGESDGSLNKYHNYLLLTAQGSQLDKTGSGIYKKDISDGRYWISIGSNRGIVKSVSFKKTDMMYTREARFFANGIDGLLQLSNVYVATIEMYGNTLFYPGMEVFINPWGIGGTKLGDPTKGPYAAQGASIANKLGFGGYHTIISVKSSIGPKGFNTIIEAQWYFSGDQQGSFNSKGKAVGFGKDLATKQTLKCGGTIVESENLGSFTGTFEQAETVDEYKAEDNSVQNGAEDPTTTVVETNQDGQTKPPVQKQKQVTPQDKSAQEEYAEEEDTVASKNRKKRALFAGEVEEKEPTSVGVLETLYESLEELSQGQCAEKHAKRKELFEKWLETPANKEKFESLVQIGEDPMDIFENEMNSISDAWDEQYQKDNPLYSDTATKEQRALAYVRSKADIDMGAIDSLEDPNTIMMLFDEKANDNYFAQKDKLAQLEAEMQKMDAQGKRYVYENNTEGRTLWSKRYLTMNIGQKMGFPEGHITWDKHTTSNLKNDWWISTADFNKKRDEYKSVYDQTVDYENLKNIIDPNGEQEGLSWFTLPSKQQTKIERNLLNPGVLPPECAPSADRPMEIYPFEARVHYIDLYKFDDENPDSWGEKIYNEDYPFKAGKDGVKFPTPPAAPSTAPRNYQEDASDVIWIAYKGYIWYPGTDRQRADDGWSDAYLSWSSFWHQKLYEAKELSTPDVAIELPAYDSGRDDFDFLHAIQHDAEHMRKTMKPKLTIEMIKQWEKWIIKKKNQIAREPEQEDVINIRNIPPYSYLDSTGKMNTWFIDQGIDPTEPVGTVPGPDDSYFTWAQTLLTDGNQGASDATDLCVAELEIAIATTLHQKGKPPGAKITYGGTFNTVAGIVETKKFIADGTSYLRAWCFWKIGET